MARMCASLNEVVSDDPRWPDVPNATRSDGIAGSGRRSKYAPTRRSTSIRSPGSAGRPASSLTTIVGPSIGRRARARRPMEGPTMVVSELAGRPAEPGLLIDVDRLVGAYFDRRPDPAIPSERVAFGTSGHRGSSLTTSF